MEDKELTIVELARKRYKQAKEFWGASRELQRQDILFSYGDTYNGNQYMGLEGTSEELMQKGLLTINIVDPACKKVVNSIRLNRPQAKISPGDSQASQDGAEIVEKWSRAIKSKSNADDATDCAVEMQVRGGEGYFELSIDYASPDSFEKEVILTPIRDPFCVWLDPQAVKSVDGTSAKWGFKDEVVPKSEVKMRYGIDPSDWEAELDWITEDSVIIARYVYCETKKQTLYQYADGTTGLDKDMPLAMDKDGKPISRATYIDKWWDCILLGGEDKPFHKEEWLGGAVPFCPVWGQLYCENGIYYLKGEVRNQIDQNRVINYMASKGVNSIAREELGGYLVAHEALPDVTPDKDTWRMEANGNPQKVKYFKAYDTEGKALPMPHKEVQSAMSSDKFQAMQTFLEFAHNASGQFSAPGEIAPGASGKAVNARQQQADLATFHYPDNLSRALRYCEQQLVNIFKTVHQPGQVIRLLGVDGSEEKAQINPDLNQPYSEADNANNPLGVKHIVNPDMLGKLDVVISIGTSYQTQRQEKAEMVNEMSQKNPALWQTHPDLIIETLDLPDKQAWIDRFKKVMPPGMIDGEEDTQTDIPPQVQQQMQEMQNALQGAEQHTQEMQAALQGAEMHVQQLEQEKQDLEKQSLLLKARAEYEKLKADIAAKEMELKHAGTMPESEDKAETQDEPKEEDYINPQLDEIMYKIEEQIAANTKGLEEIAARLDKPKTSQIKLTSPSGQVYTGERTEQ